MCTVRSCSFQATLNIERHQLASAMLFFGSMALQRQTIPIRELRLVLKYYLNIRAI
jgi:hypothetical protein